MKKPLTEEQKAKTKAYKRAWYLSNRDRVIQEAKEWIAMNPEKAADNVRSYRKNNPDKGAEYERAYKAAHPEKYRVKNSNWKKANPDKGAASSARRRSRRLQATPAWAEDFIIAEAYELALLRTKLAGVTHHVDHIVPLRSERVCGLHCEFNLRVIPGAENVLKGNRHWPDMPC